MKEKFLLFFRRVFRSSAVIAKLLGKIVPIVLLEIKSGRLKTDADIRRFVIDMVADEVSSRYPGYEFIIETLITTIINTVRDQLRRRSIN